MTKKIITGKYREIVYKVEESGNVSIYIDKVFYDKLANMSEAKDRINKLLDSESKS